MYRQHVAFQVKLWHYSSLYVATSVSALTLAMVLYTALIYRNVNEMQRNMALESGGQFFLQQKQLIITSCVVFCLAYLARCLIEFLYFGKTNAQVAMQGDPNYWHWLTWPGLVTDCLPIVIMALMHHLNWKPESVHSNYVTIVPS